MFKNDVLFQNFTNGVLVNEQEISLTAYRAYFILMLLIGAPCSKDDILANLKANSLLCKIEHKDSIVNSINTLRAVGCEIEKPKPSNNFKYTLINHPFKINVTQAEIDILNFLRKSLYVQEDYKIIMDINKCYSLLTKLTNNENMETALAASDYFHKVDLAVLEKLIALCDEKAVATIVYKSPVYGLEEIDVKCEKVFFENKRLYLWSWSYKYNSSSYHRVDKIVDVRKILVNTEEKIQHKNARYRLRGDTVKTFVPLLDEKIIECSESELIVEVPIVSRFNFYQRVLSFGADCEILEPLDLRDGFVEKLDGMLSVIADD